MPKRIALIDADTILYAIAATSEICAKKQDDGGEDLWFQTRPLSEAYGLVVAHLDAIVEEVEAAGAIVCLSDTTNFRYDILPTYKANRIGVRRPPILADLQATIREIKPYPVLVVKGLEADDVVGISCGQLQDAHEVPIMVSSDKDLRGIPGYLYQGGEMKHTTRAAADRWHLYQTLIGDSVDNYTGCPKMGPVRAEKLLSSCEHETPDRRWRWITGAFNRAGCTDDFALTQARVARILRAEDWDHEKREPVLWQPPRPN